MQHGEGRFAFLNRSASVYFGHVRDLIEDWASHYPVAHRPGLLGALRADHAQFESGFWELFLHEGYRRSGFEIEIHPEIDGRTTRPDFLVQHGDESFYLEAVSVGRDPREVAEDRRLEAVYRVLSDMRVADFTIEVSHYGIGPQPLSTRQLRDALRGWLASLDPDEVAAFASASLAVGFGRLPELLWEDAGWSLEFHAFPRVEAIRGVLRPALGMMGPGEASVVDNVSGIRRVLNGKRGRYGVLDAPLVVAVQSHTEIPTRDYEVENALFGVSAYRPADRAQGTARLFEEGFWFGRSGWRNAAVPQVVAVYNLSPSLVTRATPRVWSTLEPGVAMPTQPPWLAPMLIGAEAVPGPATTVASHFGLSDDWPGMAEPDFDLS